MKKFLYENHIIDVTKISTVSFRKFSRIGCRVVKVVIVMDNGETLENEHFFEKLEEEPGADFLKRVSDYAIEAQELLWRRIIDVEDGES